MKDKIKNGVLVRFRLWDSLTNLEGVEMFGLWIDSNSHAIIVVGTRVYECPHGRMALIDGIPTQS